MPLNNSSPQHVLSTEYEHNDVKNPFFIPILRRFIFWREENDRIRYSNTAFEMLQW